jgi:hypothetical protein
MNSPSSVTPRSGSHEELVECEILAGTAAGTPTRRLFWTPYGRLGLSAGKSAELGLLTYSCAGAVVCTV